MRSHSNLLQYMQEPLPSINEQKQLLYRPNQAEVIYFYRLINKNIFDGRLCMPHIELMARCRKYWGMCYGEYTKVPYRQTFCHIRLMDKFYSRSWMISILAHEMAHQFTWDIDGTIRLQEGKDRIMSHGPTFFQFRDKMKINGISLKVAHHRAKWFKHQDFFKC